MKNKLRMLSVLAVLVFAVSGCGVGVVNLTEDQKDMVAEYIAAAILKHDTGYDTRLQYDPKVLEPEPTPAPTPLPLVPSEPEVTAAPASGDTQTAETPTEAPEVLSDSLDTLFDNAVGVKATGYEVMSSYDKDYFVLEPQKGKKLLVVSFAVTANKDGAVALQNYDIAYHAEVDGTVCKPQQTIVESDLQFFKTGASAGKSKKALLFFEIDGKNPKSVKITGVKGDLEVTMQVP